MNKKLSVIHRIIYFCSILFSLYLLMPTLLFPAETAATLSGGTAIINITPEKPVTLAGYSGRKGLSQGIRQGRCF